MKNYLAFFIIIFFSCGGPEKIENGLMPNMNTLNAEQQESVTEIINAESRQGVTTWNIDSEVKNLWNSLRGIYYHEKLAPEFAKKAIEDQDNLEDFEGAKILRCIADIDFSGIRWLADSVRVGYRITGEQYFGEILTSGKSNSNIDFDQSTSMFTIYETFNNSSLLVTYIKVINEDIINLRVTLNGEPILINGFVSSPILNPNGFYTFYRWSGPTEIYKEWPDGTFDPVKARIEYTESREDL